MTVRCVASLPAGRSQSFDVVFVDELGPQATTVLATSHNDAAAQVGSDFGARVETTTRRCDGEERDHTIAHGWAIGPAIAAT